MNENVRILSHDLQNQSAVSKNDMKASCIVAFHYFVYFVFWHARVSARSVFYVLCFQTYQCLTVWEGSESFEIYYEFNTCLRPSWCVLIARGPCITCRWPCITCRRSCIMCITSVRSLRLYWEVGIAEHFWGTRPVLESQPQTHDSRLRQHSQA